MFLVLAGITKHALGLIESKESRKYVDRIIQLEKMRREEQSKPKSDWDHGFLDNIDHELCLIATATTTLQRASA